MDDIEKIHHNLTSHKKEISKVIRSMDTNVLNVKVTTLKKINVSFIAYFGFGKYSFSLNTFPTQLIYVRITNIMMFN